MSIVADLERLAALHQNGVLTELEFTEAKRKLFAGASQVATDCEPERDPSWARDCVTEPGRTSQPGRAHSAQRVNRVTESEELTNHTPALVGFILGLVSLIFYYFMIFPILAVVFSWRGLATFEESRHKNKWMAVVGLILGGVYSLMSLVEHGHIK